MEVVPHTVEAAICDIILNQRILWIIKNFGDLRADETSTWSKNALGIAQSWETSDSGNSGSEFLMRLARFYVSAYEQETLCIGINGSFVWPHPASLVCLFIIHFCGWMNNFVHITYVCIFTAYAISSETKCCTISNNLKLGKKPY